MRLHRFFISTEPRNYAAGQTVSITDAKLIHQWQKVFRMKEGSELIVLDNSGFEYPAKIVTLEKDEATLEITGKMANEFVPKKELTLYQALIKKDNFEWVIQKGTELGVSKFVPIISERSEKKNVNIERLETIAMEAAEQSGRAKLPEITEPEKLPKLLELLKLQNGEAIVFDASGSPYSTFNLKLSTYNLFLGPEGGWSEKELELFKSKNILIVSLGNMTLRAETAAIAVSALLLLN